MEITDRQKKQLWIGGAIFLVAVYYTPTVVEMASRAANERREARMPRKASALGPAVRAPSPFRGLLGVYWGRSTLPTRGNCSLKFEVRDNREKPGAFSGYSTLLCTPFLIVHQHWDPRPVIISPTSTILSGTPETGAIHFHVDDAVSVADACTPTAFTVKPFGVNQIAVEWLDNCHGGQIILARSSR